jgi:hypothetical protein
MNIATIPNRHRHPYRGYYPFFEKCLRDCPHAAAQDPLDELRDVGMRRVSPPPKNSEVGVKVVAEGIVQEEG